MRKRLLIVGVLLLALLGLAGCGGAKAEPGLLRASFGVFNTEGQLIARTGREYYNMPQEVSTHILAGGKNVVQAENHFLMPPEQRYKIADSIQTEDDFGWRGNFYRDYDTDLRISGRSFQFYDCYGQLIYSADIERDVSNPGCIEFYTPPDGDWQSGLFVVDLLREEGRYQLLDIEGNVLVDKPRQLLRQGYDDKLQLSVIATDSFVAVSYNDFNPATQLDRTSYLDIYDWQGQQFETEHDYFELIPLGGFRYADLPFYLAHYRNENGYLRYDILNAQGQVQLANLSLVDYLGGGVLAITHGWGDMRSGFADLQGRWLDGGLMNLGRELRIFYSDSGIYNTNGLLIAAEQFWAADGVKRRVRIFNNQVLVAETCSEAADFQSADLQPTICRHCIYDVWGRLLLQEEHELLEGETCFWFSDISYDKPKLPKRVLQKYQDIRVLYDDYGFEPSGYFYASFENPSGRFQLDVLDSLGRVVLTDVKSAEYLGQDIFEVQQGFSRGLMNCKGEWLFRESVFADLED